MPDARGHGHSEAPSHGYNYANLAADVEGLIETLELTSPVLIGHSMGGLTAAMVASRQRKHLRGLVLVDPTFLTARRQQEVYESDVAAQHRRILTRPLEDLLAELLSRHSHRSHEIVELRARARFQTSIHAFDILKPPNPDYLELVTSLTVPSLLVFGDVGAVISPEVAAELVETNPYLDAVQITGAGHGLPYDQPERLSEIVMTFLRSLTTAASSHRNTMS